MARYELKPENVEAILFNGRNFGQVVGLLGPHAAKERVYKHERSVPPMTVEYQVFDVAEMLWLDVLEGYYVVKDASGAVTVMKKEEFEQKWQPERQTGGQDFGKWFPATPNYPLINPGVNPGVIGDRPYVTY